VTELLLIVHIAGERVALSAREVEAVVEIEALTPVPGAAPHVAGLAALRSRVVTVIDSRAALGLTERGGRVRDAVLTVIDGHAYALLVDAVEDVVETSAEPQALPGRIGAGWSRAARASIEADGTIMLLLDIASLVAGPARGEEAA
jgi:purine-binding chemotaxis protein CheW